MRALLVTNDYPPTPGGIQQYLANLVFNSQADIRILGPAHDAAPSTEGLFRGHRSYMLPGRRTRQWVRRHIDDFEPDVLVFGAPHPLAQMGPALAAASGLPFVVVAHGAEVTVPGAVPGLRQVLARTLRRASLVFTVSSFTEHKVAAMGARRTEVLGAGVDLDAYRPSSRSGNDRLVLACVSRFVPRKGHTRVIAAAEQLTARSVPAEVLIVGRGRLERRIRRAADRAAVPVRLEVDVPWSDLPGLYADSDVFVMPARSRWFGLEVEGLGIVYLEAAAAGLPVVAGRSGGAPETVVPGQTGYVAESVAEIVEAVELISEDVERYGAAGRGRAEALYSWEAVARRFDDGLQRAVDAAT